MTEFKSCKAADIQGKYKTISADYEILDQMFKIVSKKNKNYDESSQYKILNQVVETCALDQITV